MLQFPNLGLRSVNVRGPGIRKSEANITIDETANQEPATGVPVKEKMPVYIQQTETVGQRTTISSVEGDGVIVVISRESVGLAVHSAATKIVNQVIAISLKSFRSS